MEPWKKKKKEEEEANWHLCHETKWNSEGNKDSEDK